MNIKSIFMVSLLLLLLYGFSQPSIEGKWKSVEKGYVIEIYSENDMFFGKIIDTPDEDSKDEIGHLLINSLSYNNSTNKYEGKVKTTSGISAKCKIELINESKFEMKVNILFISKTQTFIRTK